MSDDDRLEKIRREAQFGADWAFICAAAIAVVALFSSTCNNCLVNRRLDRIEQRMERVLPTPSNGPQKS